MPLRVATGQPTNQRPRQGQQPAPQPNLTVQNLPDWILRQNIPSWLREQNQGASADHLTGLYRNHLYGDSSSQGAQSLVSMYADMIAKNGAKWGNKHDLTRTHAAYKPPAAPGTPPPAPGTTPPAAPGAAPGIPPPGATPGTPPPGAAPGAAPGTPPPPPAGGGGAPSPATGPGLRDIYDVYLSTVPIMEQERDKQVSTAMANAGFSGNRYGTSSMKIAGDIGAETALKQNQMLNQLMHTQNEADRNRQLQASGMGMQLGGMLDQMERGKLDQLFNFGKWEQGRMDDYGKLAYQDFENNKYGLLPMMIQYANGQSGGSAPTPYAIQQPGGTGAADWLTLLAGLFD